ncbi:FkbM family methyltransferase [Sorangium sp. So ce302]|uniref:FkbM family methyltransferase n=1 Tax=unclassified Sorangium TaxID=2621164 RepID=UPI003F6406E7
MTRVESWFGIARSLAMYYGVPLRGGRMARLYGQFVTPGSLCFDVGAHAGDRIRAFRCLGARVVAVEPQAAFVRLLRGLYGRDGDVVVLHAALGRAPGRARLFVSERAPTVTTLSRAWIDKVRRDPSFRGVRWSEGAEVEVRTLDALIDELGVPAFVKIDVEGFEAEVLSGLSRPLPALSFEYLPAAREIAIECVERLTSLGDYRYNWSRGESLVLGETAWLDADGIRRFLASRTLGSGSGDVYARLGGWTPSSPAPAPTSSS